MPNILRSLKKTKPRGQGLVEFALILPLLLLLVWGVIEFGRLLFIYTEVSNAAREAVRYGVARGRDTVCSSIAYADCEGIILAAQSTTVLTSLDPEDPSTSIDIGYDHGGGSIFGVCDCYDPPEVHLGDRLVITITHQVEPLVLFRAGGPMHVTFTTARTIVEEGIPVPGQTPPEGEDGDGLGESPEVTFVLDDPFACRGHLVWDPVTYADSYITYRTLPTPTLELDDGIVDLRYPITGTLQAQEGEEYAVRGFNEFGRGPLFGRDTVAGCNNPAETEDLGLTFTRTVTSPCAGYFSWKTPPNAIGFYLYDPAGVEIAYVTVPRYPITDAEDYEVANGEEYVVTAYNGDAEGLATAVTIGSCPLPPDPPGSLTFELDQGTPQCTGHLDWVHATGADWYEVSLPGADEPVTVTSSRYPSFDGTMDVTAGEVYTVTAVNSTDLGDFSSAPVSAIADGCFLGRESVDVTYYLHSEPSPPERHSDAPPPLFMDERFPSHSILYNYNSDDPAKRGREVLKGGSTPGSTPVEEFLEWLTSDQEEGVALTLSGGITLTLWGQNPANQTVVATVSLYEVDAEDGYSLISQTAYSWPAMVTEWQPMNVTLSTNDAVIEAWHRLSIWVVSDNAKSLHFAYDTIPYPSKIEFTGRW